MKVRIVRTVEYIIDVDDQVAREMAESVALLTLANEGWSRTPTNQTVQIEVVPDYSFATGGTPLARETVKNEVE